MPIAGGAFTTGNIVIPTGTPAGTHTISVLMQTADTPSRQSIASSIQVIVNLPNTGNNHNPLPTEAAVNDPNIRITGTVMQDHDDVEILRVVPPPGVPVSIARQNNVNTSSTFNLSIPAGHL